MEYITDSNENANSRIVLWVDDNPENNSKEVTDAKNKYSIEVIQKVTTEEAKEYFTKNKEKIKKGSFSEFRVITDCYRPDEGEDAGLNLIKFIRENDYKCPILIYTSNMTNVVPIQSKYSNILCAATSTQVDMYFQSMLQIIKKKSKPSNTSTTTSTTTTTTTTTSVDNSDDDMNDDNNNNNSKKKTTTKSNKTKNVKKISKKGNKKEIDENSDSDTDNNGNTSNNDSNTDTEENNKNVKNKKKIKEKKQDNNEMEVDKIESESVIKQNEMEIEAKLNIEKEKEVIIKKITINNEKSYISNDSNEINRIDQPKQFKLYFFDDENNPIQLDKETELLNDINICIENKKTKKKYTLDKKIYKINK